MSSSSSSLARVQGTDNHHGRTNNIIRSTSDIISNLPRNVIEEILACLPIRDAARTSVLSSKWRYNWLNLPKLVFDDNFYKKSGGRNYPLSKDKLVMIIYQVLLLHQGSVDKFTLSISELESCSEIDQFILFVSRNGVRDFTLHIRRGSARHKLPSCFFSCLKLTHLNLMSCVLTPPSTFKGFSWLTSLVLCEVSISSVRLASLITSCPLLEQFTVESSINSFYFLHIVAPNLIVLRINVLFSSVHFLKTPRLAILSITVKVCNAGDETYNMIKVFDSLRVESLHIDYHYVKALATDGIPERLPTTLNRLKILKLADICFAKLKEVACALLLIRSSPNLQKLEITFRALDRTQNSEMDLVLQFLYLEDYSSDVSFNKLGEVEMGFVCGTSAELEFIRLVLAKSPQLENMLIKPNSQKVSDNGLTILKEVIQFQRASPKAKIMYKDVRRHDYLDEDDGHRYYGY